MISFTTPAFDLLGHLVMFESSAKTIMPDLVRRVSRTATLDGLSEISDSGHTYSDDSWKIAVVNMSDDDLATLEYIIKNYSIINMATEKGCFQSVVKSVTQNKQTTTITVLVKKLISNQ